jgi:hypothetical protein
VLDLMNDTGADAGCHGELVLTEPELDPSLPSPPADLLGPLAAAGINLHDRA